MPEEDINSNNPPTWADFKPPVVTTPYGATPESTGFPTDPTSSNTPTFPPVETAPEATSPADWITTPPAPADLASQQEPAPVEEAAAPAPAVEVTLPEEPASVEVPASAPEPSSPPPPVEFSQPSSRHDDNFFLPTPPPSPEPAPVEPAVNPETPVEPAPAETTPAPLQVVAVPTPVPAVPAASLASTSAEQVMSVSPKSSAKKAIVTVVGGLVLVAAAAGGYFYLNNTPSSPKASSSELSENTAILADSEASSSWENNYSTSLLASERGGLEFLATDPPSLTEIAEKAEQVLGEVKAATDSASPEPTAVQLSSLKVKIAKVDLHLSTQSVVASGVSPEATKSANKSVDRWETLRLNQNTTVDLMDLRSKGGALSSLGITYLAAGRYTEIRLFITQASAVTHDGTTVNIEIPGKAGIVTIVKSFDISTTGTFKLIVDFNAPEMVVKSGETYHLRPVVTKVIYNDQEI